MIDSAGTSTNVAFNFLIEELFKPDRNPFIVWKLFIFRKYCERLIKISTSAAKRTSATLMRVVTTWALSSSFGVFKIIDVTQKETILKRLMSCLMLGARCFFLSSSQYTPKSSDVCSFVNTDRRVLARYLNRRINSELYKGKMLRQSNNSFVIQFL